MIACKRFLMPVLLLTIIAAALLAACGGDAATPTSISTPTTPPTPTAPAPTEAAPSPTPTLEPTATSTEESAMAAIMPAGPEDVLLIALNQQGASGQSSWAEFITSGNATQVTLSLPDAFTRADVHSGQCGDSIGSVVHKLTKIADGMSISLLEGVSLVSILNGNFAINALDTGPPRNTACGNIPAATNSVTVALDELNESGQSGWATLTSRGGDTEVVLSLSSGVMVSNLVHIHTGQCGNSLGGVAHGLSNFADGTSVTLLEGVSLDSILTGDFAVNAHNVDDAGIYTACGNLPDREPLSGGLPVILETAIELAILPDLTISVGTTVNWTERGITGHTTTSGTMGKFDGIGWHSGYLGDGDSFSYTFTEAGAFPYTCTIHPSMNGAVTVVEKSGDGDTPANGDTSSGDDDYPY